jgi:6-phosphogluconolactonase (cycloisomerase 2 family)
MTTSSRPLVTSLAAASLCALCIAAPATVLAADGVHGHVYTASNDAAGNMLMVYDRGAGGVMTLAQQVATGGMGTGAGLGSQGSVTLSVDGQWLFVVNAGSHTVSTFSLADGMAALVSTVDTGGHMPISVTESDGTVYVLNAGGNGDVSGFRNDGGVLTPFAHGRRPLSGAGVGPAEVSFDRHGAVLVVTEKNTSLITTYIVHPDGTIGQPQTMASAGLTPFGFTFDSANHLLVSEAEGSAVLGSSISSYRMAGDSPRTPAVVTPALGTGQTAACWAVATPNANYVYTANAASDSLSSFSIASNGSLTLWESVAETTTGSHPLDLATTPTGNRLYVLESGLADIASYVIDAHGHLSGRTTVAVPATSGGLAVD